MKTEQTEDEVWCELMYDAPFRVLMNPNRFTNVPSPLRLLNIGCRGGAEEWRALFAQCCSKAMTRAQLRKLLPMVEPKIIGAARLLEMLLKNLDPTT